ncbi:MAG: thiolase family protein [Candidatus Latescibacteria bacterium]|nr:thiolase family protein [Candidatus Latescibacterota bacterium]NIO28380.1 thiolase family protein [Candidatus Latescibacterota bacterium]NIO55929.1 thiolase family protein [Candidatus Latescibacterota bacterium]NIT01893.1 thiolase family protein [Candidatus Latescibacterota bacterium]
MKNGDSMFPRARIPYGTWGSSYFPAWQMSPLAEVNIGQFAGEGANRILGKRKVPKNELEYLIIGSTVPWHWKFWTAPMVSSCLGQRLPGYHIEQACATGLQAAILGANEVQGGTYDVVGVLTFDRTSDSPVGVFPERRSYERTVALSDVWDNFGFDPATGNAMITTAGIAARKYKIDRREVDELTHHRYEQYFNARKTGFLDRVLFPLEILNLQGRMLGKVDDDLGVRKVTLDSLRAMRELDTCVTGGTQTHASDGMAVMLVTTREKARELSPRPEIDIQFVAKTEVRALPSLMPEAPTLAVQKLLKRTGLKMKDIAVAKNHNPFAVNDVIFSKVMDYDWRNMNNTGCPLVWGHPQGPTLTRVLIEALEEAVALGGGYVLIFGCAAGDVGIAAILKVTEGGGQ